jgi:hypothetical protein
MKIYALKHFGRQITFMAAAILSMVCVLSAEAGGNNLIVNGNWTQGELGWTRWASYGGPTNNTGSAQWAVTNSSPLPSITNDYAYVTNAYPAPAGTAYLLTNNASFGWYQIVPYTVGTTCILSSVDWAGYIGPAGQAASWVEVDLFSTDATQTNNAAIVNRIDSVPNGRSDIFLKMDTYTDMNGYDGPFNWSSALNAVSSDGNGWAGGQWNNFYGDGANPGLVVSQGYIVVALKVGWANNSDASQTVPPGAWVAWSNLMLQDAANYSNVPQPSFTQINVQPDGSVLLGGTGGPLNGTYSVLATSDLTMPFSSWNQLANGQPFDGLGNFNYTDTTTSGSIARFYRLTVP